jgi:YbgC/YbaW family acyl-CoA thioester hydrolase
MSSTRPKAPASAKSRSLSATPAPAPFVLSEYVRWGDIDLAGIICYGAYLRVCELAETEVFRAAGLPFSEMFQKYDIWLPRKVIHAEFEAPALLDEQLRVVTYFSHIGTTSLKINYDMMNADASLLHAAAHQVLVCVSRKGFKKMPLPDGVRLALSRFALDSDTARAEARRIYGSSASSA